MEFIFTPVHLAFFLSDRFAAVTAFEEQNHKKYGDPLTLQTAIRREFSDLSPDLAAASMAQFELRHRAKGKMSLHPHALYTGMALEQASSSLAADYHASLFEPGTRLLELCAGIGGDTSAFAVNAKSIIAVEADPVTGGMLRENMRMMDRDNVRVLFTRAEEISADDTSMHFDAVWADPSRRAHGKREIDTEAYSPSLADVAALAGGKPCAVKIAPAADVEPGKWNRIFLAVGDECKEQIVTRGLDVPPVMVVDAASRVSWSPENQTATTTTSKSSPEYIIEPHNAIVRAGLVREYLAGFGAEPVDPRIAYGVCTHQPANHVFHRSFRIIEVVPFSVKRVQDRIDALEWGPRTEIKKRGFPLLPEQLAAKLRWTGNGAGVLICTRIGDKHVVYVCERVKRI